MRISDGSSDVCSSDLAPDRDGLSFPCGGDNFGGRKFDRAGDTELAEQRVYVAARNYAAQQRASVGCHEASNLRIITKQVPDRKKAADGEEEALAIGILAEPVALGRPAVCEGPGVDRLPHAFLAIPGGDTLSFPGESGRASWRARVCETV